MAAAAAEPGMQYAYCTANDGCTLAFQTSLPIAAPLPPRASCIILIHGFSGSSAYFTRNYGGLVGASGHWVVAPDLRGHGNSGRPRGGYHVARLAADLRDLIAYLRTLAEGTELDIVPVGCSIGAAVLWTYVELFGCSGFRGFVFVDQAPLQDRTWLGDGGWDAGHAHLGCFDEATMLAAQRAWVQDPAGAHRELVAACLGYRHKPEPEPESGDDDVSEEERRRRDEAFFTGISARCDQTWLARLLADHTRYDHREAIEEIDLPTLVMAGRRTGCFPLEGMRETVRRVEKRSPGRVRMSVFDSGHWLFYEEPERFNREVLEFVDSCTK
ncbi:hypothetical protein AAE478_007721 [Parahypoxylon ruwenzoriense]